MKTRIRTTHKIGKHTYYSNSYSGAEVSALIFITGLFKGIWYLLILTWYLLIGGFIGMWYLFKFCVWSFKLMYQGCKKLVNKIKERKVNKEKINNNQDIG